MKLHLVSALIILALLAGTLTGCTTNEQTAAPSAPLEIPAAKEAISAQPVLTTVTADSSTDCSDQYGKAASPCVQERSQNCSPCDNCGKYDCSGTSCTGQSTRRPEDSHHGDHHNRHH